MPLPSIVSHFALPIAGAAGLGLTWGWWSVLLLRSTRRPWISTASLLAATAGACFVVQHFARRPGALAFACAAAAAAFAHLAWRHSLQSHRHG
jgi:NhaP-type Na+/H+ or K+/H+ antiporter